MLSVARSPCALQCQAPLEPHADETKRLPRQSRGGSKRSQLLLGQLEVPGGQQHPQVCGQADHPHRRFSIHNSIEQFARALTRLEQSTSFDQQPNAGRRDERQVRAVADEWKRARVGCPSLPEQDTTERRLGTRPLCLRRISGEHCPTQRFGRNQLVRVGPRRGLPDSSAYNEADVDPFSLGCRFAEGRLRGNRLPSGQKQLAQCDVAFGGVGTCLAAAKRGGHFTQQPFGGRVPAGPRKPRCMAGSLE